MLRQGDNCRLIRIYRMIEDGRRQIIAFAFPNDFLGFGARDVHDFSADAIIPSSVRCFSKRGLDDIVNRDVTVSKLMFSAAETQLRSAHQRLVVLGRRSAKARIAWFLSALWNRTDQANSSRSFEILMGRRDIADYVGLTIETVSRALTELREDDVITLPSSNHVVICNPTALRELAEDIGAE